MKDRLTELIRQSDILCDSCGENAPSYCAEAIADYLLENGVIVPPCRMGDTVYYLEGSRILEGTVKDFIACPKDNYFVVYVESKFSLKGIERFGYWMFGKRIFLTRAEAEQALKGMV